MTIIQSVFTSSEGLNCSAGTCSALQRGLSLRTGASAESLPLPRHSPSCSPFRPRTQIPLISASQLSNWRSGHSAAPPLRRRLPNTTAARAPQEHLTLELAYTKEFCAKGAQKFPENLLSNDLLLSNLKGKAASFYFSMLTVAKSLSGHVGRFCSQHDDLQSIVTQYEVEQLISES